MQTTVPTSVRESFSKASFDPSVPPVMSTSTLPQRFFSAPHDDLRGNAEARRVAVFRDLQQQLDHRADRLRLLGVEDPLQVRDHLVVPRRVHAHERQAEQARGVDGAGVVQRQQPAGDLADAGVEQRLRRRDRHADRVQDVGLHPHHVAELGQRAPLGVVGEHEIQPPLLAQPVREHQLADLHVDADDDRLHLGLRRAVENARVGVGVRQALEIEERAILLLELVVLLLGRGEFLLDPLFPARVRVAPRLHRGAVDVFKLHVRSSC